MHLQELTYLETLSEKVCWRGVEGLTKTLRGDRLWSYNHFCLTMRYVQVVNVPKWPENGSAWSKFVPNVTVKRKRKEKTWLNLTIYQKNNYDAVDHRTFKRQKCTVLDRVIEYQKQTHPSSAQVCVFKTSPVQSWTHSEHTFIKNFCWFWSKTDWHVERNIQRYTFKRHIRIS